MGSTRSTDVCRDCGHAASAAARSLAASGAVDNAAGERAVVGVVAVDAGSETQHRRFDSVVAQFDAVVAQQWIGFAADSECFIFADNARSCGLVAAHGHFAALDEPKQCVVFAAVLLLLQLTSVYTADSLGRHVRLRRGLYQCGACTTRHDTAFELEVRTCSDIAFVADAALRIIWSNAWLR